MKSEEELRSLLEFLEKTASERDPVRYPCEVCVDCREMEWSLSTRHLTHTTIMQDHDHGGVDEWIKCLRLVLEVKEDRDKQAKHRFRL